MPFYVVKTPNAFSEGTAFSPSRKLARTSTGVLWCCYAGPWVVPGVMQIFVAYSVDDGVTWVEEQITTADVRRQQYPSIAIDSADNVHLVWRDYAIATTSDVFYRRRTAAGWDAIEQLTATAPGDWQSAPSIAIDSADNIHIVWLGEGWGANPTRMNVQYRQRTAAGAWQAQESVTDIAVDQRSHSASIAIDIANVVHVAWMGQGWGANPGVHNIQYRQRVAGVWGAQEAITDLATWQHMPCIALDSLGNVHVAWYAEFAPWASVWDIYYRERVAGVWQAIVQLTNVAAAGCDQYQPSIAIDSSDNIHIVWYGNGWGVNTFEYSLQHLKRTAGVWEAREPLSDRAWGQMHPVLIWAFHPTIGGQKPNIVDNYLFVFIGCDLAVSQVEFYAPLAPVPFVINKSYALSREEL